MDKLPDELLDDIALFAELNDLGSLAGVERRFYEPARKKTRWNVKGFDALLRFADCLLLNPHSAPLIRDANLEGCVDGTPKSMEGLSAMVTRALVVVIDECPRLEALFISRLPRGPKWQAHLKSQGGHHRHCQLSRHRLPHPPHLPRHSRPQTLTHNRRSRWPSLAKRNSSLPRESQSFPRALYTLHLPPSPRVPS